MGKRFFNAFVATAIIVMTTIIAAGFYCAANDTLGQSERRVLIIADANCDATGFFWEIDKDVEAFKKAYGRGAKDCSILRAGTKKEMVEAIAKAFKDADANDVNVICMIGHGKATEIKCGTDKLSATDIRASVDALEGQTAILLSCCFGGQLADNIMKAGNGEDDAKHHISIITESNDTESWTGASRFWYNETLHLNDTNHDGYLSTGEIYHGTWKDAYLYNRMMYIKAKKSPENASMPRILGNQSIVIAKCDEASNITHISEFIEDIKECNEILRAPRKESNN